VIQHKQGCVPVTLTPNFSAILYQSHVVQTWKKLFHPQATITDLVSYCFHEVVTTTYQPLSNSHILFSTIASTPSPFRNSHLFCLNFSNKQASNSFESQLSNINLDLSSSTMDTLFSAKNDIISQFVYFEKTDNKNFLFCVK
jgi:hypothetical protein